MFLFGLVVGGFGGLSHWFVSFESFLTDAHE